MNSLSVPQPAQPSPITGAPQAIDDQPEIVDNLVKAPKRQRLNFAIADIRKQYDVIKDTASGLFYYKLKDESTYKILDDNTLEDIIIPVMYTEKYGMTDPKEIRDIIDLLKMTVANKYDGITADSIEIANNLYWNSDSATIDPEPHFPCIYRLFSTNYEDKHVVKTSVDGGKVQRVYKRTLKELMNGTSPSTRFEFIETWAAGSEDVYLDLVRSIAYCFIKEKPVGSYILVGLRRNGKSSFVGLLHTIFGRNNTSTVQLTQLGDPHYVNMLKHTVMNASDEEEEIRPESSGVFKTIADHGMITVSVMRSNKPDQIPCNFMCFYPMNHMPQWTGSGSAACTARSLVIPFYADLSKYDKTNSNFAKETFTEETMSKLMGVVLAYATYYSSHPLEFSETMERERGGLANSAASGTMYRQEFERYFDGFDTFNNLYHDYMCWCKTYDYAIQKKVELKFVFKQYMDARSTLWDKKTGKSFGAYRLSATNKHPMYADRMIPELGHNVAWFHEKNCSVVERMNNYVENKKWT